MAARPRTHKITIPNLYRKLDKRNGKIYWQYKHPITGKFHSLGTDEQEARETAIKYQGCQCLRSALEASIRHSLICNGVKIKDE